MHFSYDLHDTSFARSDYTGLIVYLLHYPKPLQTKRHYIGICEAKRLHARIREHAFGHGSSFTHALSRRNTSLYVTKIWWPADPELERKLKQSGHHEKKCVFCAKEPKHGAYASASWEPWGIAADRAAVLGAATRFPQSSVTYPGTSN